MLIPGEKTFSPSKRQREQTHSSERCYFVAVAEAGSLKLAAEEKLHTTQPSLSREIRDLENEVGTAMGKLISKWILPSSSSIW